MSSELSSGQEENPELIWVGDRSWVACDPMLDENDPGRVIAFIQHHQERVHVVWVRDRRGESRFDTLRDAVHEVATVWRSRHTALETSAG